MAEAFILIGLVAGFLAAVSAGLWLIAQTTGGGGDDRDDPDPGA